MKHQNIIWLLIGLGGAITLLASGISPVGLGIVGTLCVTGLFAVTQLRKPSSPDAIASRLRPSVVEVEGHFIEQDWLSVDEERWGGTGFVINRDGNNYTILTNCHVIGFWELFRSDITIPEIIHYELTIRTDTGEQSLAHKILVNSEMKDFALVQVTLRGDYPVAPLCTEEPSQGDRVFAMGHPMNLDFTFTSGLVSGFREFESDSGTPCAFIQTDTAINPGNSGGPLVNNAGEVVGINTSKRKNAEGISFAISTSELRHAISDYEFVEFPVETAEIGFFVKRHGFEILTQKLENSRSELP